MQDSVVDCEELTVECAVSALVSVSFFEKKPNGVQPFPGRRCCNTPLMCVAEAYVARDSSAAAAGWSSSALLARATLASAKAAVIAADQFSCAEPCCPPASGFRILAAAGTNLL
jgi:hypothetical protein